MNNKLKEAVEAGKKELAIKKHRETQRRMAQVEWDKLFDVRVEKIKRRLQESDTLYTLVVKAVANEEKCFNFPLDFSSVSAKETAAAINLIPGFKAVYSSGEDHINSDEFMEKWEQIEVTWKEEK